MAKIAINRDSLKEKKDVLRHKINSGVNIYRILPPFGEGNNGYPYKKYRLIWGLINPTKGKMSPFVSPLDETGTCPVFEYCKKLEEESKTWSKDQRQAANRLLFEFKPKVSFFYNAVDQAGNVGVLELKKTAHDALKSEFSKYITEYNMDPTSLNSDDDDSGVWFEFTKTGEKLNTEYKVKKHQIKVKDDRGRILYQDNQSPLPENVINDYENLAVDIHKLYKTVSYEALDLIFKANLKALNLPEFLLLDLDLSMVDAVKASAPTNKGQSVQTEDEQEEEPVVAKKPAKKVMLKIEEESEEEDDFPDFKPAPKASPKAKIQVEEDSEEEDEDVLDIHAMTKEIFKKK